MYKSYSLSVFEYITSSHFNKGRIYTIHSRQSEDTVLEILIQNKVRHAIFHWYSGKISNFEKIIDSGYYFSLNPKMIQTKNGQKIIERLPMNQILFETDAPFVRYNKNIIYPSTIPEIYNDFERLIPSFKETTFKNFKRLLIEKNLYK